MSCKQCGTESATLQRCSGCRNAHYCSRDCQGLHWRGGHKNECARRGQQAPTSTTAADAASGDATTANPRSVYTLNLQQLQQVTARASGNASSTPIGNHADSNDTIYYLMASVPQTNDRSCFGPFHQREAFVPSLMHKVRCFEPRSVPSLSQMLSEAGLESFVFFKTTQKDHPRHTLEIRLHKEQNAEVKAALPCPTWRLWLSRLASTQAGPDAGHAQLKELEVLGTYLTKEAAEAAGPKAAKRALGEVNIISLDHADAGKIWNRGDRFITIQYESGAIIG